MKNVFFKYKNVLYTVCYVNKTICIYKLEQEKYIKLNNDELKMINNLLNNQYSYVYDSEILKLLINQNDKIENKDYIYNFLLWLENIIPIECRDNLYRNIRSLSTQLNINFTGVSDVSTDYNIIGGYNTANNTLTITKKSLAELRNIANTTDSPDEFYWREYSQTLLHELAHMASSNYNPSTSISLCGFDTYPSKNPEEQNRGLTEGFTEIISMFGVPNTIEIASGYYIEALTINQLILIIGNEELINAYFSNLGIESIKLKLEELIPDQNKSFQLFRNIELNYQIRNIDDEQSVLGTIQSTLLDYISIKIQKMYEFGEHENILNMFSTYEQFLITPEKLKMMNKNPNNYINLLSSLDKFKQLKKTYIKDIYDNDIRNKSIN